MTPERAAAVADHYRIQADGCRRGSSPSPFYADLLDGLAVDAARGGPAATVLDGVLDLGFLAALPLRLLAGVHREVLAGRAPELTAHYPSAGGDGRGGDAVGGVLALCADPPPGLRAALERDPQTNEVGRAASLAVGLAAITARTGLPLRLLEIGSSAGLNLRLDAYWYGAGDGWGDPASPVRFEAADFVGSGPFGARPFASAPTIADRRGCDLHPIDATTEDGALALQSYVWPDQVARMARLRGALAVAANRPVAIATAAADDFVAEHLVPATGVVTVLMHSIMWQYLPEPAQRRIHTVVADRARLASVEAPIAWLRFEPRPDFVQPETHVEIWPQLPRPWRVATSGYHGPPVEILS